jgi:hypothetical protein
VLHSPQLAPRRKPYIPPAAVLTLDGTPQGYVDTGGGLHTITISCTYAKGKLRTSFLLNGANVATVTGSTLGSFARRKTTSVGAGSLINAVELWDVDIGTLPLSGEIITTTLSGSCNYLAQRAWVVSNNGNGVTYEGSGPVDAPGATVGTTPPSLTTTTAIAFIDGVARMNVAMPTAGTGWSDLKNSMANAYSLSEYQIAAATGTFQLTTSNDSQFQQGIIDALKGA